MNNVGVYLVHIHSANFAHTLDRKSMDICINFAQTFCGHLFKNI